QGYTIQGYNDASHPDRVTSLDRGNTSAGSYAFELAGATGVTLDHLWITGGSVGGYAGPGAGSTRLTVSNSTVYGNASMGIDLEASNDLAILTNNAFYGVPGGSNADDQSIGLNISGANGATITGNTAHDSDSGIEASGTGMVVSGNTVYATGRGIDVST